MNPREGLNPNFFDPVHYGRPEILAALNKIFLEPETAKIKGQ